MKTKFKINYNRFENGAEDLKKTILGALSANDVELLDNLETTCKRELRKGFSIAIHIEKKGDYIRLSQGHWVDTDGTRDYSCLIRLAPSSEGLIWWPAEWSTRGNKTLYAEIDKHLVSLSVSNKLIEITQCWSKSLSTELQRQKELEGKETWDDALSAGIVSEEDVAKAFEKEICAGNCDGDRESYLWFLDTERVR